mgnify:FL=1
MNFVQEWIKENPDKARFMKSPNSCINIDYYMMR